MFMIPMQKYLVLLQIQYEDLITSGFGLHFLFGKNILELLEMSHKKFLKSYNNNNLFKTDRKMNVVSAFWARTHDS